VHISGGGGGWLRSAALGVRAASEHLTRCVVYVQYIHPAGHARILTARVLTVVGTNCSKSKSVPFLRARTVQYPSCVRGFGMSLRRDGTCVEEIMELRQPPSEHMLPELLVVSRDLFVLLFRTMASCDLEIFTPRFSSE
jgi:hypothetical protein